MSRDESALRRALQLIEEIIEADVDDALHIVVDGQAFSAYEILEDLRGVRIADDA